MGPAPGPARTRSGRGLEDPSPQRRPLSGSAARPSPRGDSRPLADGSLPSPAGSCRRRSRARGIARPRCPRRPCGRCLRSPGRAIESVRADQKIVCWGNGEWSPKDYPQGRRMHLRGRHHAPARSGFALWAGNEVSYSRFPSTLRDALVFAYVTAVLITLPATFLGERMSRNAVERGGRGIAVANGLFGFAWGFTFAYFTLVGCNCVT